MIFNFAIFLLAVQKSIQHRLSSSRLKGSKKGFKVKEVVKTLVSLVGINFLFGITWLFAIFTFSADSVNVAFALQFLFAFFNALQGFFIFFFFVVLNDDARQLWNKLLCPCKKKAKPSISTSKKDIVKSSDGGGVGTLSSAVPSYQSATMQHNMEKHSEQTQEMLIFKSSFTVEEDEGESSPDLTSPSLEYIHIPEEEPEDVKGAERNGTIIHGRVHRQSSMKGTHDVECVELDFWQSSDESLDIEDF